MWTLAKSSIRPYRSCLDARFARSFLCPTYLNNPGVCTYASGRRRTPYGKVGFFASSLLASPIFWIIAHRGLKNRWHRPMSYLSRGEEYTISHIWRSPPLLSFFAPQWVKCLWFFFFPLVWDPSGDRLVHGLSVQLSSSQFSAQVGNLSTCQDLIAFPLPYLIARVINWFFALHPLRIKSCSIFVSQDLFVTFLHFITR